MKIRSLIAGLGLAVVAAVSARAERSKPAITDAAALASQPHAVPIG